MVSDGTITFEEGVDIASFHKTAQGKAVDQGGIADPGGFGTEISAAAAVVGGKPKPSAPSGAGTPPDRRGSERSGQEMENSPVGKAWTDDLTSAEATSVTAYTGGSYKTINDVLRKEASGQQLTDNLSIQKARKDIVSIKGALDKANLDEDTLVHRGMNENTAKKLLGDDPSTWTGRKLRDGAFQSTSINRTIATNFTSCCPRVIFDITVPKGYKAGYLDHISLFGGEKELLIQANSAMRILGTKQVGDTIEVEAEMLFD